MTKTKSTKRALLMSGLALLMCVSMLIGSTFAWFTDSVTSSGNIIKSGTLDVTMKWADGKTDPTNTTWTDASTGPIFKSERWEPGYTEVRHIKIANEGTLALKYQLNILANGEVSELADVIDVYYLDPAAQVAERTDLTADNLLGTLSQVLEQISTTASGNLLAGEDHTITLALKMQESAGNKYQGLAIGSDFSIQLLATQLTAENDSFGRDYDDDATLPTVVSTAEELFETLAAGKDAIASSSAYNVFESTEAIAMNAQGATVTLNGDNTGATYHGYLGWVAPEVTVSNLNVTGSGFVELGDYSHQGGTKVAENLVIKDLASTLSLSDKSFKIAPAFMQYGHGTLKNCTMTGTTALTEGTLAFDLGLGQGGSISNTIEGGKYGRVYAWGNGNSTITGAEINYLQCAPWTGNLTIKAGTHIETLCIDYGGYTALAKASSLDNIVIEEGATVDTIVYKDTYNGVILENGISATHKDTQYGTYTQDEWLAGTYKVQ